MAWLREIDQWFQTAVLPYAGSYRAYARKLVGNESDADDLVQDAYAKVLGMTNWRAVEAPERFVFAIIRNLAIERFRRAKVVGIRQIGVLEQDNLPDPDPDAFVKTSAREELQIVLAAIDTLPQQCRKALLLRKIDGLSPAQIAVRMNLSVSTVEKHLAKGLRLLTLALARAQTRTLGRQSSSWRKPAIKTTTR